MVHVWAYVNDSIKEPITVTSDALVAFDLALSNFYVTWTLSRTVSLSYPLYLSGQSFGHGCLDGIIADEYKYVKIGYDVTTCEYPSLHVVSFVLILSLSLSHSLFVGTSSPFKFYQPVTLL